ncbi:MAG: indolepyruvate ferredoxin oxidoreductase [Deltaproteobacteria bacterium]|nr:MAG: indolepyruvate ferredoxin oxidoreductase [Deltaproteobacteria bacterium]
MDLNVIITGVGGQGNVLASQILGNAAVHRGLHVSIGETFGLSQRGGAVMSHVRFFGKSKYSPLIPPNKVDIVVGLEPLEALRITREYANDSTLFIVNSRPIHPPNVIAGDVEYPETSWIKEVLGQCGRQLYWLEATQIAIELGGPIILNMVMLGALCAIDSFPISTQDIKAVLKDIFPQEKLESNYRALEMGYDLIKDYEN